MMFGSINSSGAVIDCIAEGSAFDIVLPNQTERVQNIAVDIGGSLAKVVYYTTATTGRHSGGRLHFKAFETDHLDQCIEFMSRLVDRSGEPSAPGREPVIMATGGGAHRFGADLRSQLGVEIRVVDEMESLTAGLNFLMREVADEVFTYSEARGQRFVSPVSEAEDLFPYMLVNIGSGVSILKVTGEGQYERISGTSLGGGTFWGLLHELTGVTSFDAMLETTKSGDNTKVDMMVGDIYGTNYDKIGLKATNIAATMGGVYRKGLDKQYSEADIARSLLYMVSNNIGQIAYLNAQLHGIRRIYFGGYFIRGHPLTMHTLSYAIDFWSKGMISALFLRHEGFLGATGALLRGEAAPTRRRACSFTENFSVAEPAAGDTGGVSALGMLDQQADRLERLPQLRLPYVPDTVDLAADEGQRSAWLSALERSTRELVGLVERGALDAGSSEDRVDLGRVRAFSTLYSRHLHRLGAQPLAYGALTVRGILGLREQCLREVGLGDVFVAVKRRETAAALLAFPECVALTDALPTPRERVLALLGNALAGNMFDWGASELHGVLASGALDLAAAHKRISYSPQRLNNPSVFADHVIAQGYGKVLVFVDNSGADVVLGVLPLARFLTQTGATVVLAANSRPALNDVTEGELKHIVGEAALVDASLAEALAEGRLLVCASGSADPCVDLRRLDPRLVALAHAADLVVLVGMARAIVSNYHARFTCDSLRIAVFKNKMAADAAGASVFDSLCLYVPKESSAKR
ncbi:hypothetical protein IWW37_000329 [Coemansia sp. RSA 2050]|nr:hypothetical protein IWW37_000329 [Coemansia sp. RSA 2050]KAJ2736756.1 hypothetical protein IW152_000510 [Coemansia sp. BCRC 34962]